MPRYMSRKYKLQNGIAQESVLSLLLFLVAINDINKKDDVETYIFADDAAKIKESLSAELAVEAMQTALDDLHDWTQAWGFKVSTSKTIAVLFNKSHRMHSDIKLYLFKKLYQ